MPNIQIGNQIINFPNSGRDANWSQSIIDFAQAVSEQLAGIASEFDIAPRVQILSSNTNTGLILNEVVFPNNAVRGFTFSYSIYRQTDPAAPPGPPFDSFAEIGTVNGVYDTNNSEWILQHQFSGPRQDTTGEPYSTFAMSGDQLTLTTVALPGVYDNVNSKISFAAKTILVSNI